MSRRTASQSRLFYTSIETIFPALTVNLLTVLVFIIDILSLGCSSEKIFYVPRLGATYRSPAGRIDAGACVLSLRRTSTHSLGSGALVGSAVGGRQAENERTWPTSSEPKILCSCNVLKLSAQGRAWSSGSSRQVGDYLYCVKPRYARAPATRTPSQLTQNECLSRRSPPAIQR